MHCIVIWILFSVTTNIVMYIYIMFSVTIYIYIYIWILFFVTINSLHNRRKVGQFHTCHSPFRRQFIRDKDFNIITLSGSFCWAKCYVWTWTQTPHFPTAYPETTPFCMKTVLGRRSLLWASGTSGDVGWTPETEKQVRC